MRAFIPALALLVAGCTFVKMGPGAAEVRVARADADLSACAKRGEIEVSVKDRLGPYTRDAIRVRDELETLARNEAPSLKADTIQPKTEPADGGQRFLAFACRGARPAAAPATNGDSAQTVPLKD